MQGNNKKTIWIIVFIAIVAILGYLASQGPRSPGEEANQSVASFKECALAGYPVMESFPRQCRTANGELFVESVAGPAPTPSPSPTPSPNPTASGPCYVGGCSNQICSDQEGVVSTCEFRPEYACYQSAKCERQANGACGWTQTAGLSQCLNSAGNKGSWFKDAD